MTPPKSPRPTFRIGELDVVVDAPQPVQSYLEQYLTGWELSSIGHPATTSILLSVELDSRPERLWPSNVDHLPTVSSHTEQVYAIDGRGGERVWVPTLHGRHVLVRGSGTCHVVATTVADAGALCCRVIRQLLTQEAVWSGGAVLHASTSSAGAETVAFVGPSGSGKTGSTLCMLETQQARPVANDKVAVRPGPGKTWVATGLPFAWRVSPDAVASYPKLQTRVDRRDLYRGNELVKGKNEFTPAEVDEVFATQTVTGATLTQIVAISQERTAARWFVDRGTSRLSHEDFQRLSAFISPTVLDDWLDLASDIFPHRGLTFDWSAFCGALETTEAVWTTPDDLRPITDELVTESAL